MHGSEDEEDYFSDSSSEYSEDSGSDDGQAESKAQKVPSQSQPRSLTLRLSTPHAVVQGHFHRSVNILFSHVMPPRPQYRYRIPGSGPARLVPPISISLRFPKRKPVKQRKRSGGRSKLWKSWTREDLEKSISSAV
ncbi:hypothetical protein FIBSPDRAFT_999381 [Athelia psychrophila]|uniref:Uncharacterized protein n=1 Tax=Athelia psychrophila TaxID=1759441 RepID=A0A166QTD7_9AGAM|nr:hypothetical protein FIBSPDRAFT_999381 [Fibularhizoctonia sp. CBS 109695]